MPEISEHCQYQFKIFQRQYLQVQIDIKYPTSQCLRQQAFQNELYELIFKEDAVLHQPPRRYQIRILKELIKRIEASITDWDEEGISDGLMSRFATLLALPLPSEAVSAQQRSYVTYTIPSVPQNSLSTQNITLFEARNLLAAAGTTGFRTWEACLHLGTYLSSPDSGFLIANRNILELGAGTGYLSILCAKYLNAAHVTVTDGSNTLVADLAINFFLNGLQDSPVIEAKELKWGQALLGGEQAEWNQGRKVDIILGADLTYDSEGIPALVGTLVDLVAMFPAVQILFAAAIRNENTYGQFFKVCEMNGFIVKDVEFPITPPEQQEGPFYSDAIPIKLCNINKIQDRALV